MPVYYGDATSAEALGHAHLERARALVLLMNDPQARPARGRHARSAWRPHVPVLMRTRYLVERETLLAHRRDATWSPRRSRARSRCIARMLRWFDVPREIIDSRVEELGTAMQRAPSSTNKPPV